MAFVRVNPGDPIQAHQLDQVIDALNGVAGAGQPIQLTQLTDATNFAETVQNLEATNSRALLVLKSDGTQLIRVDVNGVTLGAPLHIPANSIGSTEVTDGSLQNVDLGPDVARANLLTNGGFEIWQRGAGPYTVTTAGTYAADRWYGSIVGTTAMSIARDTSNMDTNSGVCAAITVSAYNTESFVWQKNEDATSLKGRTMSYSVRVKTSVANGIRPVFWDATGGYQYGPYHTGNGQYQTLTFTGAWNSAASAVYAGLSFTANGAFYLDNASLVVGSQPANYVPLHPADDLARCQRYYQKRTTHLAAYGAAGGGSAGTTVTWLQGPMPVTPTVTVSGQAYTNSANAIADVLTTTEARAIADVTATGAFYWRATYTAEANP